MYNYKAHEIHRKSKSLYTLCLFLILGDLPIVIEYAFVYCYVFFITIESGLFSNEYCLEYAWRYIRFPRSSFKYLVIWQLIYYFVFLFLNYTIKRNGYSIISFVILSYKQTLIFPNQVGNHNEGNQYCKASAYGNFTSILLNP